MASGAARTAKAVCVCCYLAMPGGVMLPPCGSSYKTTFYARGANNARQFLGEMSFVPRVRIRAYLLFNGPSIMQRAHPMARVDNQPRP
jgi:hypothetical protein